MSALPAMERQDALLPQRSISGGSSMGSLDQEMVATSAVMAHLTLMCSVERLFVFKASEELGLRFRECRTACGAQRRVVRQHPRIPSLRRG